MGVSVAITIYNEERNIGQLLTRLHEEPMEELGIDRIVVVSSASSDRSDEIVREFAARSPLVQLVVEDARRGKASAINLALAECRDSELILLMSGDILPEPGAIGRLFAAFEDEKIGMAGGRPMNEGTPDRLVHHITRLQWELHHEVALHAPKLGEVVVFRNVIDAIPADTAVDEAALEAMLRDLGYRFAYVPDAVIMNKGPDTIGDFLKQRRRIASGHAHLSATQDYDVATSDTGLVLRVTLRTLLRSPTKLGVALVTAGLEAYARFMGLIDLHVLKKNPYIWDISDTTKDPSAAAASMEVEGLKREAHE